MKQLAPPLRFNVPVWRWTDELAAQEEAASLERHWGGSDVFFEQARLQLWALLAQVLQMRRRNRYAARRLLWRVRDAWWELHGNHFEFQRLLQDAQEIMLAERVRPALECAARVNEQRRAAARAPRNGVRDEAIETHRTLYVARYGRLRGWQKRAAIDLGMTERQLRRRLEKMRT